MSKHVAVLAKKRSPGRFWLERRPLASTSVTSGVITACWTRLARCSKKAASEQPRAELENASRIRYALPPRAAHTSDTRGHECRACHVPPCNQPPTIPFCLLRLRSHLPFLNPVPRADFIHWIRQLTSRGRRKFPTLPPMPELKSSL